MGVYPILTNPYGVIDMNSLHKAASMAQPCRGVTQPAGPAVTLFPGPDKKRQKKNLDGLRRLFKKGNKLYIWGKTAW